MRRHFVAPDVGVLRPWQRIGGLGGLRHAIHARLPEHGPSPASLLVTVTAGLLEVGLAIGLALDRIPMVAALAMHAAIVAVLLRAGLAQRKAGRNQGPLSMLFVVTTAALGPAGVLGSLLTAALLQRRSMQASHLDEWYAALFPGVESKPSAALYERILHGESGAHDRSTLAPFADVMASGTVENKQAVIALIAAHFKPAFAPALRGALNDAEPAVRVQAATAVARLENGFLRWSIFFEDRRRREPERTEHTMQLARHCDDYANTGLLDAARAETARLRALELYRECERRGVRDAQVRNSIIRLLVRLGRQSEAVDAFAPLVDSGQAEPALFAWYVECLYQLGRYALLRQACVQFDAVMAAGDGAGISEPCRLAVSLWAGHHAPDREPPA